MVPMSLLAGSNGDADIENRLAETRREEAGPDREGRADIYTRPRVKWMASGSLLWSPGARLGAVMTQVVGRGWEAGSGERMCVYTDHCPTLLFSRNQHNTVKPLSSN